MAMTDAKGAIGLLSRDAHAHDPGQQCPSLRLFPFHTYPVLSSMGPERQG